MKNRTSAIAALAALICCTDVSTVFAGDLKAYHGSFCDPTVDTDAHRKQAYGYSALEESSVICPIVRDMTVETGLPHVYVEGFQFSSSDSDFNCTVQWLEEDNQGDPPNGLGYIRGLSETRSSSDTTFVQLDFNSTVYDSLGWPEMTSGGEGTMSLVCNLEDNDQIAQYRVEENVYSP